MSSVRNYIARGAAEAQKLNLMKGTLTRIISALNDGIEKQDAILRGATAKNRPALESFVLQKKAEANKMLASLPKMLREITNLITEYDSFLAISGNNPNIEEIALMITRMVSLRASINSFITDNKNSPYIKNLLSGIAGGRRKSKRSKSAKRKNRTRRV
jgi:hypothetical protein